MTVQYLPIRPLTDAEKKLVAIINTTWTAEQALSELKSTLQTAVEVELSTLPIYLYTYYSINRTDTEFPKSEISRFADQAGGVIMSVAVEEMLHMSLSSNVLFSLGQMPQIYMKSPGPYPTNLPGHSRLGPDHKKLSLPLAKFSLEQMWHFLEIEYPATADAPPQGGNWTTIGQIYSYIRCIIHSNWIQDSDFQQGPEPTQIQPSNYSPNSIDTVYPTASFHFKNPVPAGETGSAAGVAAFPSTSDSHAGKHELITIDSKHAALQAIETIDAQGEGFDPHKKTEVEDVDDLSAKEESHYYKFLMLQSALKGYNPADQWLAHYPPPPVPAAVQFGKSDLEKVIFNYPDNPVAADYPPGWLDVANVVSGLYQYMLIMTESIFLQPAEGQKKYFNRGLHYSMIWILDKIIQAMRGAALPPGECRTPPSTTTGVTPAGESGPVPVPCIPVPVLAPTFENYSLGTRTEAFGNLKKMCHELDKNYGSQSWYKKSYLKDYVKMIPTLPDVSRLWQATVHPDDAAPITSSSGPSPYAGLPQFPANPPQEVAGDRHACLGLNDCANLGRTQENACAGQGYCSTALAYNFKDPATPIVSDHTCHVLNACAGQGGCGLYGTSHEQNQPGANECATLGSCATPINAERFSTDGPNKGKSVWLRARALFTENRWPLLREKNAQLPPEPPVPNVLFEYGPTIEWIQDYSKQGMTACGSSGMSGAGSCS